MEGFGLELNAADFSSNSVCSLGIYCVFNNRAFSHDVTAAMLVFQDKEVAAMMVYQT